MGETKEDNLPVISEEEQKKLKWRESFIKYPQLIEEDFVYTLGKVRTDFYIEQPDVLRDALIRGEIAEEVLIKNNDEDTLKNLNKSLDNLKKNILKRIDEITNKWEKEGGLSQEELSNLEKVCSILGDEAGAEKYRNMKEKLKTDEAK